MKRLLILVAFFSIASMPAMAHTMLADYGCWHSLVNAKYILGFCGDYGKEIGRDSCGAISMYVNGKEKNGKREITQYAHEEIYTRYDGTEFRCCIDPETDAPTFKRGESLAEDKMVKVNLGNGKCYYRLVKDSCGYEIEGSEEKCTVPTECNSGYTLVADKCLTDEEAAKYNCSDNATYNEESEKCECNQGYTEHSGKCVDLITDEKHTCYVGKTSDSSRTDTFWFCGKHVVDKTCDGRVRSTPHVLKDMSNGDTFTHKSNTYTCCGGSDTKSGVFVKNGVCPETESDGAGGDNNEETKKSCPEGCICSDGENCDSCKDGFYKGSSVGASSSGSSVLRTSPALVPVEYNSSTVGTRLFGAGTLGNKKVTTFNNFGKDNDSASPCAPCPAGSYCVGGIKTACPYGSYTDTTGKTSCTVCADGTTTTTKGAKAKSECVACYNADGAATWMPPTYNTTNQEVHYVYDKCTIKECAAGYSVVGLMCIKNGTTVEFPKSELNACWVCQDDTAPWFYFDCITRVHTGFLPASGAQDYCLNGDL